MTRIRTARTVGALLCLLVTACSSPGGTGSEQPNSWDRDAAARLVRSYLQAVSTGRFDEAMAARCTAARRPRSDRALFISQAKDLVAEAGAPHVTNIREVPRSGLRPMGPVDDPHEIVATVRYTHGAQGELQYLMGRERGAWRLRAWTTPVGVELSQQRPDSPDGGDTAVPLKQVVPSPPKGAVLTYQGPTEQSGRPSPRAAQTWSVAWKSNDGDGARVDAERFYSAADARLVSERRFDERIPDAVEAFRGPSTGVVGVRYLGYAWLWAQATTVGPVIDEVHQQFGSMLVSNAVSGLATDADDHRALELAAHIRRLALE